MKNYRLFFLSCVLFFGVSMIFSSCRKYPDGPTFSIRTKTERVANNWTASSILRNNIDESVSYETFTMNFTKGGRLTWTIKKAGEVELIETADWELASVKEQIRLQFDTKDPVTNETRLLFLDIRKLEENDLWVSFLSDGDYYDIRLE